MITQQRAMTHAVETSTLADILERVLDKGIVIAGDIKIRLVDVELLTIQIRLLIASVDKAKELGIDWWARNPDLTSKAATPEGQDDGDELRRRVAQLEAQVGAKQPAARPRRRARTKRSR